MKTFWVIEAGNEPKYWNGYGSVGFGKDIRAAIKFYSRADAETVKAWICRNHALRTVEHQELT